MVRPNISSARESSTSEQAVVERLTAINRLRLQSPVHFLQADEGSMKFVFGNGEQLRERLRDFPSQWASLFLASKILIIGVVDSTPVAAYGIRSILNVAVLYVKEGYRGQGIGRQMWKKAYDAARKQGIHFFTAETPFEHLSSKYGLLLFSRYNCKVIKRLQKRKTVLMVFPFTTRGDVFYVFLRIVCSMLPSDFLGQIVQLMSEKTAPRVIEK